MRVDVLVSGDPPGSASNGSGTQVRTLLQNIEVLSAGTDIQKDSEGKPQQVRVVNLLVTPDQAEILSLATGLNPGGNMGHIQLVLRNPLDTEVAQVNGTGMAQLFGAPVPPPMAKRGLFTRAAFRPAPAVYSIVVYNGAQRSEQKFVMAEGNQ